jgi:tetratricopeptide (TPR) repeat protein
MNSFKRTLFAAGKLALAAASVAVVFAIPAQAQEPAAATATIHGSVIDPAGIPVTKGFVKLTTDKSAQPKDMTFPYSFPLDSNGHYTGTGIKPGDYIAFVFQGTVTADYQEVVLKAGDDKTVTFDMTREEYMKSLSPERKKEIEEYKKKYAAVSASNTVIKNLNATLKTVRADLSAAAKTKADVSQDVADMKQAVQAKPDVDILWLELGNAEQAQADHLAKADKAAGTQLSSDTVATQDYADAATNYQKAIDLDKASSKPDPHIQASADNQLGDDLAKSGKIPEASAAFDDAAKIDPPNAGMYYNNAAAVLFNAGEMDAALAAAEKAIAADPNRPDPYFIKGQVLISKTTLDPKTQKLIAPPGCAEAYEKYLELAPDGPQAPTVREVLTSLGEKVDTSYRAGRKKK